jgi:hypothetical protein
MRVRECNGLVETLRGENVLFTGKVTVDGEHLKRAHCCKRVETRGGRVAPGWSCVVTVLVHGDLQSANVIDPQRGYSRKLVSAERAMAVEGRHVHVIDSRGFEALLHGRPAPCYRLRRQQSIMHAETIIVDAHLGGPGDPLS